MPEEREDTRTQIVEERLRLERTHNLHAYRSSKAAALQEIPTYADYIAARMDEMAEKMNV